MARRRITPLEFDDATEVGAVPARDDTAREGSELPTVSAESVARTTDTSAIPTLPDGRPVPEPVSGASGSDASVGLPPPPVSGLPPEFSVEGAPPSSLADATLPMQTLSALREDVASSAYTDATVPLQTVSRLKREELPSLTAPPPPSDNLPSEASQPIKLPAAIDYAPPHLAVGSSSSPSGPAAESSSSRSPGPGDTIERQAYASSEVPTADTGDVAHPVTLPSVPNHPATAARAPAPELSGAFQSYEENDDVHALPTEALPIRPGSTSQSESSAFQTLEKQAPVSARPSSEEAPSPWAPVTPSSPGLPAATVRPQAPTPTPTVQNSDSPSSWAPDGGRAAPPSDLSASGSPQLLADEVFDDVDELSQSNIVEQPLPAETGQWTAPASVVAAAAPVAATNVEAPSAAAPIVDAELVDQSGGARSGAAFQSPPAPAVAAQKKRRSGCGVLIAAGIGVFFMLAVVGGGVALWFALQEQDDDATGFLAGILESDDEPVSSGLGSASDVEAANVVLRDADAPPGNAGGAPKEVSPDPVDDKMAAAKSEGARTDRTAPENNNTDSTSDPDANVGKPTGGRSAGVDKATNSPRARLGRTGRKGRGTYLFRARTSSYSARKGLNRSVRSTLKAAGVSLLSAPPAKGFDLLLRAGTPRTKKVDDEIVVEIDCRLRVREQPSSRIRRSMSATGVARGPSAKKSALEAEAAESCGKDLAGSAASLINDK